MLITRNLVITFLIILLAAITILLAMQNTSFPSSQSRYKGMDSFMTGAYAWNFNQHGELQDTLDSPSAEHYLTGNITHSIHPYIIAKGKTGPAWHIISEHGQFFQSSQTALLSGNVKIVQPPGQGSRNVTLLTSQLKYYPNKKLATSNKAVTIIQPGATIHGVGMIANIDTGVIKLLNQTSGQYDQAKQSKQMVTGKRANNE